MRERCVSLERAVDLNKRAKVGQVTVSSLRFKALISQRQGKAEDALSLAQ